MLRDAIVGLVLGVLLALALVLGMEMLIGGDEAPQHRARVVEV